MSSGDPERPSKNELIDGPIGSPQAVLKLQHPAKTSRTSSKPASTDRKERRKQSRPGGAKPGHEGHSRISAEEPDTVVVQRPNRVLGPRAGAVGRSAGQDGQREHHVELPEVASLVQQHRRFAVVSPGCRTRMAAPRPAGAASTPFGQRRRPSSTCSACASGRVGSTSMLRRAETRFEAARDAALSVLRRATAVASNETFVGIEGANAYLSVFRCGKAAVHHVAPTRGASWRRRSWTSVGRPCLCRTATRRSRATPTASISDWCISPATSPVRSMPVVTPSPYGSSCSSTEPYP